MISHIPSGAPGSSPGRQVQAARQTVLAVPDPQLAALAVTGKDRVTWLNGLVTCDLLKRREGEARYGLVVARSGRVVVDVIIVFDSDRTWVVVPASQRAAIREHLDHYLVMEDAEIAADAPAEVCWLHGPRSGEVLAAAREAGASGGAVDRTELGGAIVLFEPGPANGVRAAIDRAVAGAGGVCGDAAGWEALRVERGVPLFGVDFDEKMYPQEAALENTAVSFDKGCYLGQEVVCMLEMRGHVKRRLVGLVFDPGDGAASAPPERGAAVTDAAGAAIGEVTSAASSPTLGRPIALAVLKRAQTEPGTPVVVGGRRAEVVRRPA